jgi:HEAT repeat protein
LALIDALNDAEQAVRSAVYEAVGVMGKSPDKSLVRALRRDSHVMRAATCEFPAKAGYTDGDDGLIDALRDKPRLVRAAVASTLGEAGGRNAVEVLLVSLREAHPQVPTRPRRSLP